MKSMPLPPDVANLPTIVAEPWLPLESDPLGILEGPAFDRDGNLYLCFTGPHLNVHEILRVTPDKRVTQLYKSIPGTLNPCGIAIHKDGRIFVAGMAGIITIIGPEGLEPEHRDLVHQGERLAANDLVFDAVGNVWLTDFRGSLADPIGGVYRLDKADDYRALHRVAHGLATPNGIAFAPSGKTVWIGETSRNQVVRIDLQPDGLTPMPFDGITCPFRSTGGPGGPDSNAVDSEGNLYQCLVRQGRVIVLNDFGVPVANVLIPVRDAGRHLHTANLAFRPQTDRAYLVTAGIGGPCIYSFQGLAMGLSLYSHA